MNIEKLHELYLTSCVGMIDKFEKKHNYKFTGWVGGVGCIASFIDEYFFNMDDLIYDLVSEQPKGLIFDWMSTEIEANANGSKIDIVYLDYLNGKRQTKNY